MVKLRYVLLIGAIATLVAFAVVFGLPRRPTVTDFCTGLRKLDLSRLEFEGQDREATLTDPTALYYLASLPKLSALPQDVRMTNALFFVVKLFDKRGSVGTMYVDVSTDEKVLALSYYRSLFSDTSYSFILVDSNAPPKLRQVMHFLLTETNRGRFWTDAPITP